MRTTSPHIVDILEQYKVSNAILSPLNLESFRTALKHETADLLQQNPNSDSTRFISFKQLNQDAIDEFDRSLQQSKAMWNMYGRILFSDTPVEKTTKPLELLHNRDTFRRIRRQNNEQLRKSVEEIRKEYKKIRIETHGVKSYPSLSVKDQFKQQQLKRQIQLGCKVEQVRQETELALQEIEKSKSKLLNEKKSLSVYVYYQSNDCWVPSAREEKLFLYGGAGNKTDISVATQFNNNFQWNFLKTIFHNQSQLYHTGNLYKNILIIYGGTLYQQEERIQCEITSQILQINLNSLETKLIQHAGIVTPRKGHIAEMIGRYLLVQGGIDNRGKYLNDFQAYDIITQRWCNVESNGNIQSMAYHKSCLVLENKSIDLYRHDPDSSNDNQGIYIFGGQTQEGQYTNKLYKINVRYKPIQIQEKETQGLQPLARAQHSMNYCEQSDSIIIYGGKNDDESSDGFLNDICILNLKTMTWSKILIKGQKVMGRCSHTAQIIDQTLYIFGGLNQTGYLKSEFLVIELEQMKVQELDSYNHDTITSIKCDSKPSSPALMKQKSFTLKSRIEQIKKESEKIKKQQIPRISRNFTDILIIK